MKVFMTLMSAPLGRDALEGDERARRKTGNGRDDEGEARHLEGKRDDAEQLSVKMDDEDKGFLESFGYKIHIQRAFGVNSRSPVRP